MSAFYFKIKPRRKYMSQAIAKILIVLVLSALAFAAGSFIGKQVSAMDTQRMQKLMKDFGGTNESL